MMTEMNLVTGYRGSAHVTSNDVAALNRAIFGDGACVIDTGNTFAATLQSDMTTLQISDGEAIIQGRHARISSGEYDGVSLTVGTTSDNRMDYIVIQLTKDESGIEDASIVQVCGTAATGTAELPELTQEDLNSAGATYQFPLYTIEWTGTTMGTPEQVFTPVANIAAQLESKPTLSNGVLTVSNDEDGGEAQFKATNNLRTGLFEVSKTGRLGIWDTTNGVWAICSDTDQSVYIPHPLYVEGTQVPTIVSGVTASTTVAAGSYVDVSVTFGHTFSSAPVVQISPIWNTTSTNSHLVQFTVTSRSTTGCTIRILNGGTSAFIPAVMWTAIGT